jgi:methionyl-tRNA formyltransferase
MRIDWAAPAVDVHRRVRVGGAWTTYDGSRLKVWRTALLPGTPGAPPPGPATGPAGVTGPAGSGGGAAGRGAAGRGAPPAGEPGVPPGIDVPAGDGLVRLVEVQPEGRRRMPATAWANGLPGDPRDGLGR